MMTSNNRSEIFSFRLNIIEKEILEKKRKELKSRDSLGTIAKKLALTRNLPTNLNDTEFLDLMSYVFEELKKLSTQIDKDAISHLRKTYASIMERYEETIEKTLKNEY
jgi:hypothetical protein